jgi:hypothetical protein
MTRSSPTVAVGRKSGPTPLGRMGLSTDARRRKQGRADPDRLTERGWAR